MRGWNGWTEIYTAILPRLERPPETSQINVRYHPLPRFPPAVLDLLTPKTTPAITNNPAGTHRITGARSTWVMFRLATSNKNSTSRRCSLSVSRRCADRAATAPRDVVMSAPPGTEESARRDEACGVTRRVKKKYRRKKMTTSEVVHRHRCLDSPPPPPSLSLSLPPPEGGHLHYLHPLHSLILPRHPIQYRYLALQ